MKEQAITQEEIYHLAQRGLFIRGEVNKHSSNRDKAKIYLLCGIPVAKGVYLNYVEYRYTYDQLSNGRDFVSHLEQKVFAPDAYIKTLEILRMWFEMWFERCAIELFGALSPEVIVAMDSNAKEGQDFKQLPLTDPTVITHLARFQGMIGQARNPKIQDLALEQVYVRLGALISQQLKKWSQMVG